jgi:hypothetical protein
VVHGYDPNLPCLAYPTNSSETTAIERRADDLEFALPWPSSANLSCHNAVFNIVDIKVVSYRFVIRMLGQVIETIPDEFPNPFDPAQSSSPSRSAGPAQSNVGQGLSCELGE